MKTSRNVIVAKSWILVLLPINNQYPKKLLECWLTEQGAESEYPQAGHFLDVSCLNKQQTHLI